MENTSCLRLTQGEAYALATERPHGHQKRVCKAGLAGGANRRELCRRFGIGPNAAYAFDRNWSLRGEYQHVEQQANIGFFDYTRRSLALKLRYDFK